MAAAGQPSEKKVAHRFRIADTMRASYFQKLPQERGLKLFVSVKRWRGVTVPYRSASSLKRPLQNFPVELIKGSHHSPRFVIHRGSSK
jgi:hypothetical protein